MYLVGDVIDFWRMRRARYWPQSHNDVVQKLLRKARKGTRVILTPGNHDDMLRGYVDHEFGRNDRTALMEHESGELERCAGPKRPKLSNGRPRGFPWYPDGLAAIEQPKLRHRMADEADANAWSTGA